MKEYVKIYCCGDCVHYDWKKHRCRSGAKDDGTGREHFYRDCPLGIHTEIEEESDKVWIKGRGRMIIKIKGLSAVAIGMFFIGYLIGWVEATHDDIF